MTMEDEYTLLSGIELFANLEPVELKRLIFVSRRYQLEPGEYLFRQGDTADMVFGVLRGRLSVLLQSDKGEIHLSQEEQGDLLGEIAAISGKPRTASVRADSACEVLGIDRELFVQTMINSPQAALNMMRLLCERLVKHDEQMAKSVSGNL